MLIPPRRKIVEIAKVDWDDKTVTLKYPAIQQVVYGIGARSNPNIPGKSVAAEVNLRYSLSGTNTIQTPLVRIPAAGYAGEAYQAAPVTCANELRLSPPALRDVAAFAQQCFNVYSKPAVSGSVTLPGDLPEEFWWLDRRVNFKTWSHGVTSYERIGAHLLGISYRFGGGGSATLDFSTDRRGMLQGTPK
jgi:hypothetical protein